MNFKRLLQIILHPFHELLFRQKPYNPKVDEILNHIIVNKIPVQRSNEYTHTFNINGNEVIIWTENFPYSYGYMYNNDLASSYGPSIEMCHKFDSYLKSLKEPDTYIWETKIFQPLNITRHG